jgi:hypothetical protein
VVVDVVVQEDEEVVVGHVEAVVVVGVVVHLGVNTCINYSI